MFGGLLGAVGEREYLPLLSTNVLSNFTAVGSVVHEEDLKIFFVGDEELLESVREQVAGSVVLLASDLWHFLSTLHSSSGEAINTSDLSVVVGLQHKNHSALANHVFKTAIQRTVAHLP